MWVISFNTFVLYEINGNQPDVGHGSFVYFYEIYFEFCQIWLISNLITILPGLVDF